MISLIIKYVPDTMGSCSYTSLHTSVVEAQHHLQEVCSSIFGYTDGAKIYKDNGELFAVFEMKDMAVPTGDAPVSRQ